MYIVHSIAVPGTLIQRVVDIGVSPVKYVFNCMPINSRTYADSDGHLDSIRQLLGSSNSISFKYRINEKGLVGVFHGQPYQKLFVNPIIPCPHSFPCLFLVLYNHINISCQYQ